MICALIFSICKWKCKPISKVPVYEHHLPFLKFQLMQGKQILFKCNYSIFEQSAEQDSNLLFDQQKVCDSPLSYVWIQCIPSYFFFVVILKLSPKKLISSRFYPKYIWIKEVKTYSRSVTAASQLALLINKKKPSTSYLCFSSYDGKISDVLGLTKKPRTFTFVLCSIVEQKEPRCPRF